MSPPEIVVVLDNMVSTYPYLVRLICVVVLGIEAYRKYFTA